MTGIRKGRVAVVLLCVFVSVLLPNYGKAYRGTAQGDFALVLDGARCVMQHGDPYDPNAALQVFRSEGGRFSSDPSLARVERLVATFLVYLPTALFVASPLAMLPSGIVGTVWLFLTFSLLALAGYLIWDLAGESPVLSGWMIAFTLLNREVIALMGNISGIAVGLCLVAAWCFLRERYAWAGVVMLAISLVLKPHDAGFVWLFFLLKGGTARKRALQTLAVVAVLALGTEIWIAPSSPHWVSELQRNIALVSQPGGTFDPGISGSLSAGAASVINLQGALSVLWDYPRFYNLASYLISGVLIALWIFAVVRRSLSRETSLLALAAISALALLPVYHRPYDAKLLLLAVPAFAMLWKQNGMRRWIALIVTSVAILSTSDFPLIALTATARKLGLSTSTMGGKLALMVFLRPGPLALLALGCFYLWVFWRYTPPPRSLAENESESRAAITAGT